MGQPMSTSRPPSSSSDWNSERSWEIDMSDEVWIQCIKDSFMFVWCDASIGAAGKLSDTQHTIKKLADIINQNGQLVHTFDEINACREFITEVNNVCLITSGSMGEQLVPLVHNLDQVHSIYVFCYDTTRHNLWAKQYKKVQEVSNDITAICQTIKSDIISRSFTNHDRIEFDLITPTINSPTLDKQELCLIYSKLTKIILLNMDSLDHGKQDMINYCRNEYINKCQIQLINDLESNYSQHDSIWWYTRNCFLRGIVNRALRTHDLYTLCSMHRFIKDMNSQLRQLQNSQPVSTGSTDLYFGQVLSKSDFDRLEANQGGLMCVDQFLSANIEKGIAMMFLKQQNLPSSNKIDIRVLFQIHIDQTNKSDTAYANIGSVSQFVHEQEYLLSMFSIFRINKIEKLVELPSVYFVRLVLVGSNDLQYRNLTQSIQEEQLKTEANLSELGHLIKNQLYIFKCTNKLYKQVLMKQKQDLRTIILHYDMAIIYNALGDYDKSIGEYNNVINIARENIRSCYQKDDACLVPLYANMGLTYQKKKNFNEAIINALRALRITFNVPMNDDLKRELQSSCNYCLGSIHDQEGQITQARSFYEEALKIRQEYLPLGHTDITDLQRRITLLCTERNDSV